MKSTRILVTSAAGRTGAQTVKYLLAMGFKVRAMVRREDHRSATLKSLGAEIVVGDQWNYHHLCNAMVDVQRAYHCAPFAPNLLENLSLFALAAEQSKLEVVALMSAWNGTPDHPSVHSRGHWIANQLYRLLPNVDVIHINPGLFAFTYFLSLPVIVNFGMFVAPLGTGLNAPPSNEDIAKVAAHCLADPSPHIGKCYRPTGPTLLSPPDVADIFTKVLKRKVKYKDVPYEMFAKAALAQGFPLFDISQVKYFAQELRHNGFALGGATDHVKEVTGDDPEPFEQTAERYFANPQLVHPSMEIGNRMSTAWFMLRMMATRVPDLHKWETNRNHPFFSEGKLAHQDPEWRKDAEAQRLNLLPLV